MFTLFLFILVLALLVLVHELGHFLAAKRFGMRVDEFGFGFPPRIWGKKYRGTLYSINLIPLGGFVKIKGVAGDDEHALDDAEDRDSFGSKPFWQKSIVLFAGIAMNVLLGILIFSIVFVIGFPTRASDIKPGGIVSQQEIVITGVLPESPAALAGIVSGDVLESADEEQLNSVEEVQQLFSSHLGVPILLRVERDQQKLEVSVTPKEIAYGGQTVIGIGIGLEESTIVRYPWYRAILEGVRMTFKIIGQIFLSLFEMLTALFSTARVSQQLSGPIGIAVLTGEVARLGIVYLLQFVALLSINLAVFNLLPIPALDGGRIFFTILERVRRKPVNQKIEAIVHNVGFLLLILLVLLVTIRDITKLQ